MFSTRSPLLKILVGIILIVSLALGILIIPNLAIFDEAQLPEITEHLRKQANPNIEGNALYSLYGINAATNKDMETVGKAVVKRLQEKHGKGQFAHLTAAETLELYGDGESLDKEWSDMYPASQCNARLKANCFTELLAEISGKPFTHPRLLAQFERYKQIIKMPHLIEETRLMDYKSPVPPYGQMMQLGKLNQAKAYEQQGLEGLLASSKEDMRFWRMALTDSQIMIGRMVAIASLRRNLSAISYVISKEAVISSDQTKALQALLIPLTADETDMEKVLTAELRFSAENWKTAPKEFIEGSSVILATLYQPTASSNWFYRQTLKPVFAFNKMSASEFYERAQAATQPLEFSRFNPYNLGGKISQSQNWQYAPYIGRSHDLAGIYSLVGLQLELKTNPPQNIAEAIKTSAYKNPYTKKPFDYDATTKSLSFRCFEAKDECKISL
ncbi:hypothetical protein GCM10011613_27930 [Cellvibrio zantedeschiae]|uniref:Uncharacterized protein n=1 Tax=Cellvibrio zantedeschiae TaxID=1237077 RepID=A0ABQ3B657_9GAMM|nr:hypothetical protein [Cellvibrio zantedeschiae]GGY81666.1 hypothetical protein GCM10011613_27930 [Cellvibrio zantedeschiae]